MSKATRARTKEADSTYFLKILIYFVLGTIWIKFNGYLVFPIGLVLGVLIAQHDHFSTDRKIEYPILIISAVIGMIGWGVYFAL